MPCSFLSLRRLTLVFVAWLLTACQAVPHAPEELSLEQSWRIDATGLGTLQEAQAAMDWQPLRGWKSWGFGPETVWVRVQLPAAPPQTRTPWAVVVRPAFLDRITIYDPAAGLVMRTGDALPPDRDSEAELHFTVQIPALAQERAIYLAIQSTSSRTLKVEVLPYGEAQQGNRRLEWLMGFVMTTAVIFSLWGLAQWTISRERVLGAFVLKQVAATFWAFFATGFARILIGSWLPEGALTAISSSIFPLALAAASWFFSVFLEGYRPAPIALKSLRLLSTMSLLLLPLQWMGQVRLSLMLTNACALVGTGVLLMTALSAMQQRARQPISMSVLLAYFSVYCTLNSLPALILLGWIEAKKIVLFGNLAFVVLDGLVMFVMLQVRASHLQREKQRIEMALQSSLQQTDLERRRREDQHQLFSMLAHEMKTPLAVLRVWMEAGPQGRPVMERAIQDMNRVIERCAHSGQVSDEQLQPRNEWLDAAALTQELVSASPQSGRLRLQRPSGACELRTDAQMLSIVLSNLLENAGKYSVPDTPVVVDLAPCAGPGGAPGWRWRVDNAVDAQGWPEADKLFVKYYRSPRAKKQSGSGLGLFLVKSLLELLQGQVHYSPLPQGVRFEVWLPHKAADLPAAA